MNCEIKTAILFEDDFNALRKFMEERKPIGKGALIIDPDRTRANILERFPELGAETLSDDFLASLFAGTYTILDQRGGEVEISYPSNCLDPDEIGNSRGNEKIFRKIQQELMLFSIIVALPCRYGDGQLPMKDVLALQICNFLKQNTFTWELGCGSFGNPPNEFLIVGKIDERRIAKVTITVDWDPMVNNIPTLIFSATYRNKLPSHHSALVNKFQLDEKSDFLNMVETFTHNMMTEKVLMSESPEDANPGIQDQLAKEFTTLGIKTLQLFEEEVVKSEPDILLIRTLLGKMYQLIPVLGSSLIQEELRRTLDRYRFLQNSPFNPMSPNPTQFNPNNIVPGVRSPYPPSGFGFPPNGDFRIPVIRDPDARAFMAMKQFCMGGPYPTENDYMGPADPIRI